MKRLKSIAFEIRRDDLTVIGRLAGLLSPCGATEPPQCYSYPPGRDQGGLLMGKMGGTGGGIK